MTKSSWWDVMQRLKRLPASCPVLPAVLAGMDCALHCERYTPRPAHSNLLAALKLQLLAGSPDPIAQIVCQARKTTRDHFIDQRFQHHGSVTALSSFDT